MILILFSFLFQTHCHLQRIQVEHLTVLVIAFVVTVDLIALRGKMADVARREWQCSVVPRQKVVIPASNICHFASQRNQINRYNERNN